MKKLSSLKYTAALLPALALGMPMTITYASDTDNHRADQHAQTSAKSKTGQASQAGYLNTKPEGGFHTDKLIGTEVKNRRNNETVGEVSQLVLDRDGKVVAAIVSVGGTLGMGARDVAIGWDQIERKLDGDSVTLSVDLAEGSLDNAPDYGSERSDRRTGMTTGMTGPDRDRQTSGERAGQRANQQTEQRMGQQASVAKSDERTADLAGERASQTAQQRAGQTATAPKSEYVENKPARGFHSDSLVGKEIKNQSSKDSVGTVNNLLLDHDGQIVAVVIGVGGLMGIGERDVAISWDQIERRVDDDDETTLWVNLTSKNLTDAPRYTSERTTGPRQ